MQFVALLTTVVVFAIAGDGSNFEQFLGEVKQAAHEAAAMGVVTPVKEVEEGSAAPLLLLDAEVSSAAPVENLFLGALGITNEEEPIEAIIASQPVSTISVQQAAAAVVAAELSSKQMPERRLKMAAAGAFGLSTMAALYCICYRRSSSGSQSDGSRESELPLTNSPMAASNRSNDSALKSLARGLQFGGGGGMNSATGVKKGS